ncbi:MAG: hypothetical protein EOP49_01025 [Sphingobacteriales bacterium]|nr:MAG: hypothetical protein EOP49_01025 [Sphingobacteriales bacterium]
MYLPRLEQLKNEGTTWLRMLDFLQQENILLKHRLGEILQLKVGTELLENAELYQTSFLNKDLLISVLRHDIKIHEQQIQRFQQDTEARNILTRHSTLRLDMEKLEQDFTRLRSSFYSYFSETL